MRTFLLINLLIYCLVTPLSGQQHYLAVENGGRVKRIQYYPGEMISLKVQGDRVVYRGMIAAVTDSLLTLHIEQVITDENGTVRRTLKEYIPMQHIAYVYAKPSNSYMSNFMRMSASSVIPTAPIFIAGMVANSYMQQQPIQKGPVIFISSLFVGSLLWVLKTKPKYRIGKRWQLKAFPVF